MRASVFTQGIWIIIPAKKCPCKRVLGACVREGHNTHAACPGVKWGKGSVDVSKPHSLPHSDSTVVYLFPDYKHFVSQSSTRKS